VIARVEGTVVGRSPGEVVIDCGGVGYLVNVSDQTEGSLPPEGRSAALLVRLIVRDDSMTLYGFGESLERDLFLSLLGVASVGPKLALAVVGSAPPETLAASIAAGDSARLQSVPGVGKRTAERICLELKEQMVGFAGARGGVVADTSVRGQAREALLGLGMGDREVEELLDAVEGETPEELIQAALREAKRP